jgi:hypothetical protein
MCTLPFVAASILKLDLQGRMKRVGLLLGALCLAASTVMGSVDEQLKVRQEIHSVTL